MKKKLLATFLALCMVTGLLPISAFAEGQAVAQIGSTTYATLQEAINAATAGDTITLIDDVVLDPTAVKDSSSTALQPVITITRDLKLDLSKHSIKWDQTKLLDNNNEEVELSYYPVFFDIKSTVTITGDGTLDAEAGNNSSYGINVNGGNLTIESGTFYGAPTAVQVQTGSLFIEGGTFGLAKTIQTATAAPQYAKYVINAIDANYKDKTATISITGGTFIGFDPSANPEGEGTSYLPAGSALEYDEETDTIVENTAADAVASVNGVKFTTLAGAVAYAKDGDTVKLLKDAEPSANIPVTKAITVELNHYNIKFASNYGFLVYSGGNLNLTGAGTIEAKYCVLYMVGAATDDGTKCSATVGTDVTLATTGLEGYADYAVIIQQKNVGTTTGDASYGVDLTVNGTLKGIAGIFVLGNIKQTSGNVPQITLSKTAVIDSKNVGIAINGYADVTVDGATISGGTGIEIRAGKLTMSSGTVTGTGSPIATAPNGSGTTSDGAGIAVSQHTTMLPITVNITGGKISGYSALYQVDTLEDMKNNDGTTNRYTQEELEAAYEKIELTIAGGSFSSTNTAANAQAVYSEKFTQFISGGIFSSNPSAYCATDLTGVANTNNVTNSAYPFMVGEAGKTAAQVVAGSPVAVSTVTGNDDNTKLASAAVNALAPKSGTPASIEGASVEAAAATVANENTESGEKYKNQLNDAETVYIVVERYMDIQVTGADATDDQKSLTLDITPMYRKVATTVNTTEEGADSIKTDGDNPNAVSIETGKLDITGPVTVTLPLPSDFVGSAKTAYVQHKGHEYTATIDESNVATFTNPHGFSEFTITLTSEAVAQIGEESYTSLQAAVNAVQNGQTITLKQNGLSATVKGNKTFAVKSEEGKTYTANLTAAPGYTLKDNENGNYTITKNTSSSSGSGTTTYAVNLPSDVTNGTLAASPKSAAKGATVTLTVTPAEGYQLATLTVTDANGNQLTLTKKSDTQYTFTMPASKVTVQATFEEIPQIHVCPAEKFTDVDTTQWYHEAIDYVIEAGMMNGVAADKFAPNGTTTRAMIVTILYRLEGEPAVAGASAFTDVESGAWYADPIAWAAAKGVVNGTSPTTFDPNDPITREQMAAILYRYASYKGYDVTEKADLSSYTDAGQISAYATDAMAWANAQGLITGVTKTTLEPQGNATRAQVATILMRFCETVAK